MNGAAVELAPRRDVIARLHVVSHGDVLTAGVDRLGLDC
jgi:hypothetical protein